MHACWQPSPNSTSLTPTKQPNPAVDRHPTAHARRTACSCPVGSSSAARHSAAAPITRTAASRLAAAPFFPLFHRPLLPLPLAASAWRCWMKYLSTAMDMSRLMTFSRWGRGVHACLCRGCQWQQAESQQRAAADKVYGDPARLRNVALAPAAVALQAVVAAGCSTAAACAPSPCPTWAGL